MSSPPIQVSLLCARCYHSLTDFKRKTTDFIKQLKETGAPLVLTVHSKVELVVQDAAAYQKLLEAIEQFETVQTLRQRLAGEKDGRSMNSSTRSTRSMASRERHELPM
jgi:prevent-host-death family protein